VTELSIPQAVGSAPGAEPLVEPLATHDRRLAACGTGLVHDLNVAGLLETPDVQVAQRLGELAGESNESARLALALAVRALRAGSVSLDLALLPETDPQTLAAAGQAAQARGIPLPEPARWAQALADSALAARSVVRVEHGLVYLDRYWQQERFVADTLRARIGQPAPPLDPARLAEAAARVFPAGFDEQRAAGAAAAQRWTALVTGGPGTGKTTAVAGLLALLVDQAAARGERPPRIALAAPTGKAAARLQEAVAAATARLPTTDRERLGALPAVTMHRLLGWRGASTRFRHDRGNRLPHDVIVLDETSMVSLTLMARLLEALRPQARLVLVGDPDQLSSVEAGAVLADLVAGLAPLDPGAVATLRTSHRFGAGIGELAAAVRDGDAATALRVLHAGRPDVTLLDPADPATLEQVRAIAVRSALALRTAAEAPDESAALAALDGHRLLCAHREGPFGAAHWNRLVERWLADETGVAVGAAWGREWYAGRPLIVTENDYGLGLYNGDTGVVLAGAVGRDGDTGGGAAGAIDQGAPGGSALVALIAAAGAPLRLTTSRLASVETMHALTIHKSQGSQAAEVTVVLPEQDSRLLTRELLYTAITRAQQHVRVVATDDAIRHAVCRPAQRASGLRRRLTQ
jgi:exodeoxyribonuclease V alpha subunit